MKRILFSLILCFVFLLLLEGEVQASSVTDFRVDENKLIQYVGTKTEVTIPSFITVIGSEAFSDAETLTKVSIHNKVTKIEYRAFSNCTNLEEVRIPDSVEHIGASAFADCTALDTVYMGENVRELGTGAFSGCTSLETIKIHNKNSYYSFKEGILYNKDKTKIVQALAGSKEKIFNMPNSVEEIMEYAFWKCNHLETINLSNKIKKIPKYAFANCKGLKNINIPYSVSTIEMKAFESCDSLENVRIPESVRSIHKTAFDGCTKVKIEATEGSKAEEFVKDFYENNQTIENQSTLSGNLLDGIKQPDDVKDSKEDKEKEMMGVQKGSPQIKVEYHFSDLIGAYFTKGNFPKISFDIKNRFVFDTNSSN